MIGILRWCCRWGGGKRFRIFSLVLGEAAEGEAEALEAVVRRVDCAIGTVEAQVVRFGSTGIGGAREVEAVRTLKVGTGTVAVATEDKVRPSRILHSIPAIIVIVESLVFSRRATGWEAEGFNKKILSDIAFRCLSLEHRQLQFCALWATKL